MSEKKQLRGKELDAAVHAAFFPDQKIEWYVSPWVYSLEPSVWDLADADKEPYKTPHVGLSAIPRYSESLDAALELHRDGWRITLTASPCPSGVLASIVDLNRHEYLDSWRVELPWLPNEPRAATYATAYCLAVLEALKAPRVA